MNIILGVLVVVFVILVWLVRSLPPAHTDWYADDIRQRRKR